MAEVWLPILTPPAACPVVQGQKGGPLEVSYGPVVHQSTRRSSIWQQHPCTRQQQAAAAGWDAHSRCHSCCCLQVTTPMTIFITTLVSCSSCSCWQQQNQLLQHHRLLAADAWDLGQRSLVVQPCRGVLCQRWHVYYCEPVPVHQLSPGSGVVAHVGRCPML
jgi:hypothetical protein